MVDQEGYFPKEDGFHLWASEINKIRWRCNYPVARMTKFSNTSSSKFKPYWIVCHSDTNWACAGYRTTDGGSTWLADGGSNDNAVKCLDNPNYAIRWETNSYFIYYTTDGSATAWSGSTVPNLGATCSTVCYPSANKAYLSGKATNGTYCIWYSNDAGQTWTQASSGPTSPAPCIIAESGNTTTAYAINVDNRAIYKTTDGGANWANTGWTASTNLHFDQRNPAPGVVISDNVICYGGNNRFATYDDMYLEIMSDGTKIPNVLVDYIGSSMVWSDLKKINNSYYIMSYCLGASGGTAKLWRSTDSCRTWHIYKLFDNIRNPTPKAHIDYYSDNPKKLLIPRGEVECLLETDIED